MRIASLLTLFAVLYLAPPANHLPAETKNLCDGAVQPWSFDHGDDETIDSAVVILNFDEFAKENFVVDPAKLEPATGDNAFALLLAEQLTADSWAEQRQSLLLSCVY